MFATVSGSHLQAIELLTQCFVLVQGQTVSIMGSIKGIKQAHTVYIPLWHWLFSFLFGRRLGAGQKNRGGLFSQRSSVAWQVHEYHANNKIYAALHKCMIAEDIPHQRIDDSTGTRKGSLWVAQMFWTAKLHSEVLRRTLNWRMKIGSASSHISKIGMSSGKNWRQRRRAEKKQNLKHLQLENSCMLQAKKKAKDVFPPQPAPRKEDCWHI